MKELLADPAAAEKAGPLAASGRPAIPRGRPIRALRPRMRRAASGNPASWLAPPVSTTRLPIAAENPDLLRRSRKSSKVSSTRARMIRDITERGI